ncbi:MFS transporter [Thioflexithrix psekupsensis]|uniref:Major facilitator superfamily (MFS) profile domain-containing protein n=1 Tax=Thioflexithrix psekupsensis TaxID=1570016 RepID=A0A251XAV3_9GAMM|nr:MFS transporter [Thioflexithrix psekupsensis]OUD15230.1 hypothetical protein TPSD3_01485 [Thioflexithrix psekupsensis]
MFSNKVHSPQEDTTYYANKMSWQLTFIAAMVMIVASVWLSYQAWFYFEQELIPEIDKKSVAVGHSVIQPIRRNLNHDMPFENMVDVEVFFKKHLENHKEIIYIAITDEQGKLKYKTNPLSLELAPLLQQASREFWQKYPLNQSARIHENSSHVSLINTVYNTTMIIAYGEENKIAGLLHLGVNQQFVKNKTQEVIYDVITLLIISLLITSEFLRFLINHNIAAPIHLINVAINQAKKGNFTHTIRNHSSDEVGIFIKTFNKVIIRLNEYYQQGQHSLKALQVKLAYHFAENGRPNELVDNVLINIRIPVFLFMFAEELPRSFFPRYVEDLYQNSEALLFNLSKEVAMGLPISLFMLVVAIAMPISGRLSDKYGSRRIFLIGLIPSTMGFILTAFSQNIYELLASRCLSAFGYGMMFIACQGYVAHHTTGKARTQGMAMFVAAVMGAAMCGPPVGGILADQLGFRAVFMIAALLAIPSALMVYYFLVSPQNNKESTAGKNSLYSKLHWSDFALLLKNIRFVTLSFFAALPTKFALTGFIFYFIPIYLSESGDNTQSTIGRILMLYGITAIIITPISAKLADKWKAQWYFVASSGFLAGMSVLFMVFFDGTMATGFSVALLGVAHAIGIAPQLALVPELCQEEAKRIGQATIISLFRLIERLGAVLGSLVMAALLTYYKEEAVFILGGGLAMSALIFSLIFSFDSTRLK